MSNNQVSVIPSNMQLPAHLQTADIAAEIAAANAAAAGGVRAGGFPRISIGGNKFSIEDGADTTVLMNAPTSPGAPALPMGCLEIIIVDANPALTKTFYQGDYVEGLNKEPDCRSANGVTPDADAPNKQAAVCATCPQNQWGSKISKLSGKEIRACDDSKQLAVLPAMDLQYKMLGLQVKKGSLSNWGKYISALSGRGFPVFGLVTNVTFDLTQTGVLQFSFNRFLSEAESTQVASRKQGDDAKHIVAQSRSLGSVPVTPTNAATPAPAALPALPSAAVAPPAVVAPVQAPVDPFAGLPPYVSALVGGLEGLNTEAGRATYKTVTGIDWVPATPVEAPVMATTGLSAAPATATTGFGAAPAVAAPVVAAQATQEPPKRTRAKRTPDPLVVSTASTAPAAYYMEHIPQNIRDIINTVGADSAQGMALLAAFPIPATVAPVATPAPVEAPVAPTTSFGAAIVASPAATAAGASLAEKLRAKLGLPAQAGQ